MVWGQIAVAAITAGASYLSSKSRAASAQSGQTGINYKGLVRDAEKAGFNPLTALRAGGAAGYMQTHAPVLSSGAFLGDALIDGFNAFMSYEDQTEMKTIEKDLALAQLAKIQAETGVINRMGDAPQKTGSSTVGGVSRLANSTGMAQNIPEGWEPGKVTVTNPEFFGPLVNPNYADAAAFEDRYGDSEAGSTLVLARNATADIYENHKNWYNIREGSIADWWVKNWDQPYSKWGWDPISEGANRYREHRRSMGIQ